jgi:D-3-phosphoglycerate dehydrogenase
MKVLITDPISSGALFVLEAEDTWDIIVTSPTEFTQHLAGADAIVCRGATKITKEVLDQAPKLRAIGRAGIGVDNVDVEAATAKGVVVMNTPGGNAISVAEHTLALMFALARLVPQANESTKAGKWEKKKFMGTELNGKTLGIIGLGNIGMQVARRARPLGMTLIAHDPFVSRELAKDRGVELLALDELFAKSDYITLHLSVTPETERLLSIDAFAKMKDGVRLVNCARGELIDPEVLEAALVSGKVAGAALDVFAQEPPTSSPLLAHENVIATPHIGGSTEEAQETVSVRIAEQVRDYLNGGVVTNAVNMPSISAEQYGKLRPYLDLASRLGSFVAQIATARPQRVTITYSGNILKENTSLIRNAALTGILNRFLSQKANLINAAQVAAERGLAVSENHRTRTQGAGSLSLVLETEQGERAVQGAVFADQSPRLIRVDGINVETSLDGHMVFLKNSDVPGVIGRLGTILGDNQINIADFSLGRREPGPAPGQPAEAVAVIRIDAALPKEVLDQLLELQAVNFARTVELR